ncbi:MAG: hypothetical protein KBT30_01975 [Clostridiales bacterium]|nr:hypothetical protein [Candidatus Apopatousia equi]
MVKNYELTNEERNYIDEYKGGENFTSLQEYKQNENIDFSTASKIYEENTETITK